MKMILKPLVAAAVLTVVPALFTACSTVTTHQSRTSEIKQGVPGGKVTKINQLNATVTAIDTSKRKVTLVTQDAEKFNLTAGPEIVNFPQIRVGDQLKVSYREEIEVRMARPGEKIVEDATADVNLAEEGRKPAMKITTKDLSIATVTKIDTRSRKMTLQFNDGSIEKVQVRDDIDLSKRSVGEKVRIRVVETFAIKMEKP